MVSLKEKERRRKISETLKKGYADGRKSNVPAGWNKGMKVWWRSPTIFKKGHIMAKETREKISRTMKEKGIHRGKGNPAWKGGVSKDREYRRLYVNKWQVDQCRTNPRYKLNARMSTAVYTALRGKKAGRHWEGLVGYTLDDLMDRLSVNLGKGMDWRNYGKWHIDHIKPKSAFNYRSAEDR